MTGFFIRLVINALALVIATFFVPGLQLAGITTAFAAAFVLGIVNTLIRPILAFFTFPLKIITLGIFTFVINALMLALTAALVPGFSITGFGAAFWGALLLSLISMILTRLFA